MFSASCPRMMSFLMLLSAILLMQHLQTSSASVVPALRSSLRATRSESVTGGAEDREENAGMSDAIKYLEELDKYYSQVARPRERRVGQNMASALEKLSQIKNYYNEAGRPRFGKRSGDYPLELLGFSRYRE